MLSIQNLNKNRQDGDKQRTVLDGVSFNLSKGHSLAITGDSGSGKSTLLNVIAGLENADSGNISFDGEALLSKTPAQKTEWRKRHLGIVFQAFNLIECLSVRDNILFPARLNNLSVSDRDTVLWEKLNIAQLLHKPVQALSGGEQQRVAVARALSHKPDIILADEPTGNLDEHNANVVAQLLFDACHNAQAALVLVTHSRTIASKAQTQLQLKAGKLEPTC